MVTPLYHCPDKYKAALFRSPWKEVQVASSAKYLGFQLGPDSLQNNWSKAIYKYKQRCRLWSRTAIGSMLGSRVYSTFCFSVLSFRLQLSHPPKELLKDEKWALHLFVPSPGNSIQSKDLFNLRSWYGISCQFPSIEVTSVASKLRVYCNLQHCYKFQEQSTYIEQEASLYTGTAQESWMYSAFATVVWQQQVSSSNGGLHCSQIYQSLTSSRKRKSGQTNNDLPCHSMQCLFPL